MKIRKIRTTLGAPLALAVVLLFLVPTAVFSQTPTSGALLTINGSVGAVQVNRNIYDSQIHTGFVQPVPVPGTGNGCTMGDAMYPTDAYVLQGGSWTGCDPGDAFETAQDEGSAKILGAGYEFDITTDYCISEGDPDGERSCSSVGPRTGCNSAHTICANPDTGFLTVTNKSGAAFAGTISLTGTSPGCGAASDSATNLASGASVTLALGVPGTVESPTLVDSSNCGGYNATQGPFSLTAGGTLIFQVGTDDYELTGVNNAGGEQISVLPVPFPENPNGTLPVDLSIAVFNPANFPGLDCVPYQDLSAPFGANEVNHVCAEFALTCSGGDCSSFIYQANTHYSLPTDVPAIGGPAFLVAHLTGCPPTAPFTQDILLSYSANLDPVHSGGGNGTSCMVAAFDPNASLILAGSPVFSKFVGFQDPVSNTVLNKVKAGSAVPLIWQQFLAPNMPNTTMTLCTTQNPCPQNSVKVETFEVACPVTGFVGTDTIPTNSYPGNSGLQNFGNGTYQFNLKTTKSSTGCFKIALVYGSGAVQVQPGPGFELF